MHLNLPKTNLQLHTDSFGNRTVFDRLRKKYVALTPEEWVRQNFVEYLINNKGFPAGLMANEIAITLNGTRRRCDTVIMDHFGKPTAIIEYKAPHVAITQTVQYGALCKVPYCKQRKAALLLPYRLFGQAILPFHSRGAGL